MKKYILLTFLFSTLLINAEDKSATKPDQRVKKLITISDLTQPKAPRFQLQTPDAKNSIYMKDNVFLLNDGIYFVVNESAQNIDVRLNFGTKINPAIVTVNAQSIIQFSPSERGDLQDIQIQDTTTYMGGGLTSPDTLKLKKKTKNSIIIFVSGPTTGSTYLHAKALKSIDTKNIVVQSN